MQDTSEMEVMDKVQPKLAAFKKYFGELVKEFPVLNKIPNWKIKIQLATTKHKKWKKGLL